MTPHLHSEFVEGCYRCDISRDEVTFADVLLDAVEEHWPFDGEPDINDLATLTAAVEAALLTLPVELRMEAMGMIPLTENDHTTIPSVADKRNRMLWVER